MKKILSIMFSILMLIGVFCVAKPDAAFADSTLFSATMETKAHDTAKGPIEQLIITLPRKWGGNTYSYVLSSTANKSTDPIYIKNTVSSDKSVLTISPIDHTIKSGETKTKKFAIGIYSYNGNSRDLSLAGMFVYSVKVKNVNGTLKIVNITSDMTNQKAIRFCGDMATERYANNKFKYVTRKIVKSGLKYTEFFTLTSNAVSESDFNTITKNNGVSRYYRVAKEYHIHTYKSGKCTVCGETQNTYSSGIPRVFLANECREQGKVVSATANGNKFLIYVPYGYTSAKKYDVVVLIHGGGSNDGLTSWLTQKLSISGDNGTNYKTQGKNLLDWMIYRGSMKPTIFVAVSLTYNSVVAKSILDRSGQKESALSYVIKHYSTYAKSASYKDIEAARKHFGICGLSSGATATENIGFSAEAPYLAKIFGTKIVLSGYKSPSGTAADYKNSGYITDDLYFASGGSKDQCHERTSGMKKAFENAFGANSATMKKFHYIGYSYGHNWTTFYGGFMWAMSSAFRQ